MYCRVVEATIGLNNVTVVIPITAATHMGEANVTSADRPAERVTTNSDVRAKVRNSDTADRIITSGKI